MVVRDGEAEPGVRLEPAAGGGQEDGGRRHGEPWGGWVQELPWWPHLGGRGAGLGRGHLRRDSLLDPWKGGVTPESAGL